MSKETGGPAFPCVTYADGSAVVFDDGRQISVSGMTLRDWFAGRENLAEWDGPNAVMQQDWAEALAGEPMPSGAVAVFQWEAKWRAALRYIRADAMLKERSKP